MKEYLPYIIPAVLTAVLNYLFYLWLKKRVDNSIEKYKISYSGVFKEKIDIYKSLIAKVYEVKMKLNQFQLTDDTETKDNLRSEFNDLIKTYLISRPFLSEHLVSLFRNLTQELQSVYETFVLENLKNYGKLSEEEYQKRQNKYWSAVNKLRTGEVLNEIESEIVTEIRKDLQTLNH